MKLKWSCRNATSRDSNHKLVGNSSLKQRAVEQRQVASGVVRPTGLPGAVCFAGTEQQGHYIWVAAGWLPLLSWLLTQPWANIPQEIVTLSDNVYWPLPLASLLCLIQSPNNFISIGLRRGLKYLSPPLSARGRGLLASRELPLLLLLLLALVPALPPRGDCGCAHSSSAGGQRTPAPAGLFLLGGSRWTGCRLLLMAPRQNSLLLLL